MVPCYEKLHFHLQDLQALHILLPRYLAALTPPTANTPDTACLALETITFRLRTLCMQSATSFLDWINTWFLPVTLPF